MLIEIERKFLVKGDFIGQAKESLDIIQGYLSLDKARTVRVRIQNEKAFLTIKGKTNASGLSRFEWEKEIDTKEAKELLKLAIGSSIEKIRYRIPIGNHIFEVDVFSGENKGLILAEVELQSESEAFEKPKWLGKEVSGDPRYYNANLVLNPFIKWDRA
ncbi:MAG: CYTH domain-containing protein [Bacteroidales bacterium]|nr:CYTH domain-containing protein [Bacteroidales bacterium]